MASSRWVSRVSKFKGAVYFILARVCELKKRMRSDTRKSVKLINTVEPLGSATGNKIDERVEKEIIDTVCECVRLPGKEYT